MNYSRKSSAERGYDSKWRRARDLYLSEHPLCVMHLADGFVQAAAVVDHKEPHRGDLGLFWSRSNWQSLCKSCHDSRKQRMERSGVEPGCSAAGLPLDPGHPWASWGRGAEQLFDDSNQDRSFRSLCKTAKPQGGDF